MNKMKVLLINSVCGYGSTGKICTDIAELLFKEGHECCIAYGRGHKPSNLEVPTHKICGFFNVAIDGIKSRLFDNAGFNSVICTKKFIKWIDSYNPDIIHIHNIHGYYINIKILINYLKKSQKRIIFSLYDCWLFTGHCAHFEASGCAQLYEGCSKCLYKNVYPKAFISKSKRNFIRKKKLLSGLTNTHFIYPSCWMAKTATKSFLAQYNYSILPNGIDLNKFSNNLISLSNGKKQQKILLGVSSVWTEAKGLSYFNRLADLIPPEYSICLVGKIKSKKSLNSKIIHIDRTSSFEELCSLYSSAYLFLNFTLEETQGLTTLEAFACGTPGIVFNSGGAGECVNKDNGFLVNNRDLDQVLELLNNVDFCSAFSSSKIRNSILSYDKYVTNRRFLDLYIELKDF